MVLVRWDSRAGVVLVKETTITVCTIKGSLKRYERPITQSSTALYVCLLRFIPKKEQRLSQEIKNALTTANFDNCEAQLPTTNMPVSQQLTNTWSTVGRQSCGSVPSSVTTNFTICQPNTDGQSANRWTLWQFVASMIYFTILYNQSWSNYIKIILLCMFINDC